MGRKEVPAVSMAAHSFARRALVVAVCNEQLCRLLTAVAPAANLQQNLTFRLCPHLSAEVSFWRATDGHSAM
jgi:hypothetical protein